MNIFYSGKGSGTLYIMQSNRPYLNSPMALRREPSEHECEAHMWGILLKKLIQIKLHKKEKYYSRVAGKPN